MGPVPVKILLVEDDPLNCFAFEALFEISGHVLVGVANTGQEALSLAQRHRPTHVLMDVRISGPMDGIQAAAELLRHLSCEIIFITGDTRPDTLVRMTAIPSSRVMFKPATADAVLDRLGPPQVISHAFTGASAAA